MAAAAAVAVAAVLVAGVSLLLNRLKQRMVYLPAPLTPMSSPVAALSSDYESLLLPTVGGAHIWLVVRYTNKSVPLVVFSHGNCSNLTDYLSWLRLYPNVAVYDYRGYGLSSGVCDERTNCWDLVAVIRYLQKHYELHDLRRDIVLMGRSLGTNVTLSYLDYCARFGILPPERTILIHPFLALSEVLPSAPRLLCALAGNMDRRDALRLYLSQPSQRVLVFVSARDQITPPASIYEFADSLTEHEQRERLRILDIGGDHSTINATLLWDHIKQFIYVPPPPPPPLEEGQAGSAGGDAHLVGAGNVAAVAD